MGCRASSCCRRGCWLCLGLLGSGLASGLLRRGGLESSRRCCEHVHIIVAEESSPASSCVVAKQAALHIIAVENVPSIVIVAERAIIVSKKSASCLGRRVYEEVVVIGGLLEIARDLREDLGALLGARKYVLALLADLITCWTLTHLTLGIPLLAIDTFKTYSTIEVSPSRTDTFGSIPNLSTNTTGVSTSLSIPELTVLADTSIGSIKDSSTIAQGNIFTDISIPEHVIRAFTTVSIDIPHLPIVAIR